MTLPINRAPFTALVDDDGSNTIGTPWNKAAIQGVILDPVDAARAWTSLQVTLAPGDYVDWNPGIIGDTVINIQLTAAGTATIYGFKPTIPGYAGQRITLHVVSDPSLIFSLYHEYAGASAGCQLHCRKSPAVSIVGYWAFVDFQYTIFGGVGAWTMGAYGNGIGGP
jgi:hypothetical protein